MKNFLFEKLNNFTQDEESRFHFDLTRKLPATHEEADQRGFLDKNPVIWGYENDGFWTMSHTEVRFYENNGTIHIIGTKYDESYVANYRLLSSKLENIRSLNLDETDRFSITNETHIGLKQGDVVYYAKFLSPNGELGWPIATNYRTGKDSLTDFLRKIIDFGFEVYNGLKQTGGLCPADFNPLDAYIDSNGIYLGVIRDFSIGYQESLQRSITNGWAPASNQDTDELINYGTTKWQTLTT